MPAIKREVSESKPSEAKKQRVVALSPERKAAQRLRALPINWKPLCDTIDVPFARVEEYIKFLIMKVLADDTKLSGMKLSPSAPVDEIWHSHMLLPRHYADVCSILLEEEGGLIDHSPLTAHSRDRWYRYQHTRKLYETYWGTVAPVIFWPDEAEPDRRFQMFVKLLTGKTITVEISPNDPVSKIVDSCTAAGFPHSKLNLAGQRLDPEKTARESNLRHECTVHAMFDLRGC